MSEVLDQSEVDALLAAVDKGELGAEESAGTPSAGPKTQVYDFKRPERVSKDQLRTLGALHETFARNVAANLSSVMRHVVDTELADVEQLTYSEFVLSLPNPTCLMVLSAKPLEGSMVLEINPSVLFPVVDRLLGGTGEDTTVPERPCTDIETRLGVKLVTPLLQLLKEMWSSIKTIDFAVEEVESNPQLLQVAPPHDPVVLVSFRVTMGEAHGLINLCIPYATIEPIMGQFSTQNWFAAARKADHETNLTQITRSLAEAELDVVADLALTQITVRELLELEVGDLLKTDVAVDQEATVFVEGKPKFKGRPGRNRRNKAVLITRGIEPGKTR
ncbi:MAG TPA: flagellar motor switch protein FliM [Planctomycetota bacterium]|nr:flagellar motor switch protein FliM [Planctomycetota bacterium]